MKSTAYLLHRFPRVTDTFIKREIRALQQTGTPIQIISMWRPMDCESSPATLEEWSKEVHFLLPTSFLMLAKILIEVAIRSPSLFFSTAWLAFQTSKPGLRGFAYQVIYFVEAVLAAHKLRYLGVIHVHNHFGDHSGLVTMLAARLAKIGYSISFHGPHIFQEGPYAAVKEKVLNARFVRCIGYFCRSQIIICSGVSDISTLKIVHCGLDLSEYRFFPPRTEVKRIFCAARLAPEKGIEFLIQAAALLLEKGYDIHLRLAGDGSSRTLLESETRRLGVSHRVTFLGNLDEAQVGEELERSDLFVLPSLAEGIPVSLMEAMAVGVPVIATNIAGVSELVDHEKNGLLVRPSDPEAIADAIVRMVEDFDFRRAASELGRAKVVAEFDIKKEVQKLKYALAKAESVPNRL